MAGGDARNLFNALELAVETHTPDADGSIHITLDIAQESIQRRALLYDRMGDAHYDTISAFIKSVRGSDPDAALYWLAKMIMAGEDPRFILRRLIVLSGEDIGLADPQGIQVAASAAYAYEYIGMPEGIYPIVEATLYLATAPKSNSAGAFFAVRKEIEENGSGAVPTHLMDANRDAKGFGHGKGINTRICSQTTSLRSSTCPPNCLARNSTSRLNRDMRNLFPSVWGAGAKPRRKPWAKSPLPNQRENDNYLPCPPRHHRLDRQAHHRQPAWRPFERMRARAGTKSIQLPQTISDPDHLFQPDGTRCGNRWTTI